MVIDDVELPKWAASPEEFVMLHRAVSVIHLSKHSVYSKIIVIVRSFPTDYPLETLDSKLVGRCVFNCQREEG